MDPLSLAEEQRRLAQIQGHLQIYIYIREGKSISYFQ